jgi:thioredoxin reductase
LFLAKNDIDVDVFGTDDTPMHKAMLYNYLGIEEMTGTEFQETARAQVEKFGANLHDTKVARIGQTDDGFEVTTGDGDTIEGDYLIIAVSNKKLIDQAGMDREDGVAAVDRNGRSSVVDGYAIGWASRSQKIQAIISAGDGAAAALDIMSKEAGKDVHDFDVPE